MSIIECYEVDNVDRTTCRLGPCSHSYLCMKMDVDGDGLGPCLYRSFMREVWSITYESE